MGFGLERGIILWKYKCLIFYAVLGVHSSSNKNSNGLQQMYNKHIMKSYSNNSYNLKKKSFSEFINCLKEGILYIKMYLILKGQFKMLHWEKLLNKEKVLEKKGFISFFADKEDMV